MATEGAMLTGEIICGKSLQKCVPTLHACCTQVAHRRSRMQHWLLRSECARNTAHKKHKSVQAIFSAINRNEAQMALVK